jgi:hypothetical protein
MSELLNESMGKGTKDLKADRIFVTQFENKRPCRIIIEVNQNCSESQGFPSKTLGFQIQKVEEKLNFNALSIPKKSPPLEGVGGGNYPFRKIKYCKNPSPTPSKGEQRTLYV